MTFTDQTRRLLAAGALAVLATLAAGCGSGDDEKKDAAAKRLTIEETEPSKGRYALKAPRSVEAGLVEISFKNNAKAPADAALIRVDGEHSAREVIDKVVGADDGAPIPAWLHATGGVGRTAPGQTGFVAQVLKPGTYYILDTDSGEEEGAKAHATTGGVAPLEVTGEAAGKLAATPATITAGAPKEYAFKTEGLKAGTHRVTFSNAGREPHHVVAFPFQKGATLDQVKKSFVSEGPPKGPPPVDFMRAQGTSVTEGGTKVVTDLKLDRGRYALVCFVSDRKGGPPHVAKGMIAEATVGGP